MDSNHRRREPADLQSAPVGRLGIPPKGARNFHGHGQICQRVRDSTLLSPDRHLESRAADQTLITRLNIDRSAKGRER